MIELYDIVESLSSMVDTERGALVLHRSMKVHPKFKVYKKFCYDLYLVKNKNEKTCILSYEETRNTYADDILPVWKEVNKKYLKKLMQWVASNEYRKLMKDGI